MLEPVDGVADDIKKFAQTERFVERMENFVERLSYIANETGDSRLHDIRHGLWIQTRILRGDEDLSVDDIE